MAEKNQTDKNLQQEKESDTSNDRPLKENDLKEVVGGVATRFPNIAYKK